MTETTYVNVRGVRLALSDEGSGPVVIYAHGLSSSRANDERMVLAEFAPVVASGHRLIAFDARGHGESEGTSNPDDYGWGALSKDLLALADLVSPGVPVSGIGSSMGTGTLLHAVTSAPERFDRLVLTAPPTAWETRSGQGDIYRAMADFVEQNGTEALAAMTAQAPLPAIFADVPGFPPPPDISAELIPTVFRGAGATDLPPIEVIEKITQPTLILAWAGDPGHPVSTSEKLAAAIPGAEFHVSDTADGIRQWGRLAAEFLRN
jgi:3-oxoadipate enol-lactonase